MAQAARDYNENTMPYTLIYDQSGSAAPDPLKVPKKRPRVAPLPEERKAPRERYKTQPDEKRKLKLLYITSLIAIGLMLFAIVAGGVLVSQSHSRINQIDSENEAIRLRINDLELQLEQSIDLNGVIDAAVQNGMVYPLPDQVMPAN